MEDRFKLRAKKRVPKEPKEPKEYSPLRKRPPGKSYKRVTEGFDPPPGLPPPIAPEGQIPDLGTRIRYIVKLMCKGCFVRGVTGGELADLWGLSDSQLKLDSAAASKQVKQMLGEAEADELRAIALATHQSIINAAVRKGEWMTAHHANKAFTEMAGLAAPKQHEVKTDLGELFAEVLTEEASHEQSSEPRRTEREDPQ